MPMPVRSTAPEMGAENDRARRSDCAPREVGRDTVRTSAGTFPTIVVEMRVKDSRRYGGEGLIRLHLSDDAFR